MINVCVVEVEGSDYEGKCFVLVAKDVEAAVRQLKKMYAKFKTQVRWHDLSGVSHSDSRETFWSIDADFDHVPAYFNEHTAHFTFTVCPVAP